MVSGNETVVVWVSLLYETLGDEEISLEPEWTSVDLMSISMVLSEIEVVSSTTSSLVLVLAIGSQSR